MELAKAHYFDGINDGQYADKDSITGNLHPFQEMILGEEGNPKWIYNLMTRPARVLFRTISLQIHGKWKVQDTTNSNLPIMQ